MNQERYWLRVGKLPWHELTREEFVRAERNAGFRPKPGCGDLATDGFSSGNVQGRITYGEITEIMNPKVRIFWWKLASVVVAWMTFFIVNAVSGDTMLAAMFAISAAAAVSMAFGLLVLLGSYAVLSVLSSLILFCVLVIFTSHTLLVALSVYAAIAIAPVFQCADEEDFSKKYAFLSVITEFIVFAAPMLWYIFVHQDQIKTAIAS
ncbi:hypothetical protein H6761_02915 [Candidatus Nomurabacteria bacterium]|nr:hypothetical protein [Candidatus Nomurabacteria bacterium]